MSTSAEHKNEKVFEYYNYLPHEIRMMMIDEMQPDDRCRFTRCSKLCDKEARSSKEFIYGLKIHNEFDPFITVEVEHNDHTDDNAKAHGFMLQFKDELEKKYMVYLKSYEKELWRMELAQSTDLLQLASQSFKLLLDSHQRTVRNLVIRCFDLPIGDFEIKRLPYLRDLDVLHFIDINQFFSKLRRPLRDLKIVYEVPQNFTPSECAQVYETQRNLCFFGLRLNNEQFLQLSAAIIYMKIGKMNEYDICNFIKSWQNGKVRENFQFCQWELDDFEINVQYISKFFGFDVQQDKTIDIKHHKDSAKSAFFQFTDSDFTFYTNEFDKDDCLIKL